MSKRRKPDEIWSGFATLLEGLRQRVESLERIVAGGMVAKAEPTLRERMEIALRVRVFGASVTVETAARVCAEVVEGKR
jgi:hypothetical protein